jgi:curved DNA-binding protein CbpA
MQVKGERTPAAERVPRLAPKVDPTALLLTPSEGYLLSRVDGRTPWKLLREIGGLPAATVDRCLERWLAERILVLDESADPAVASPAVAPAPELAASRAAAIEAALDSALEIPIEAQRRILEFEAQLDRPYHELLAVPRDATLAVIKKAYFGLSKEFHPDRYFRRNVGEFAKRLERVFKKIVEAYELLSDPVARAELDRSLAPETAEAPPQTPAPAPPTAAPRAPRRHAFSIHRRAIQQRRLKAKRLFEAGVAAFGRKRWGDAASSVRLAIAFDPWNDAYKERFVEIQMRYNEERALTLRAQADDALDMREFDRALALVEEALDLKPHDPDLLHRGAKLAWVAAEDLHRAKDYAQRACELRPEVASYRRTLGQIYKAAGLRANARRELEVALRLDPKDKEAEAELRSMGRGLLAPLRLGGKP